jgi:hypothetical protein
MVKKIALSIVTASSLIIPSTLSANVSSNYDMAVELARAKAVDKLVERVNQLNERTKQYILNTGDITPTIDEIDEYFGISKDLWVNFDGGVLEVELIGNINNCGIDCLPHRNFLYQYFEKDEPADSFEKYNLRGGNYIYNRSLLYGSSFSTQNK